MALQKKSTTFNFAQGIDTFNDPNQIPIGRFTALQNSIFIKSNQGVQGSLKKANGFGPLAATTSTASYLTTYNNALVGTGTGAIQSYSTAAQTWTNQGYFQPVALSVNSLIKNGYSQSNQDTALAPNGVGIVVYNSGDNIAVGSGFNQSHYKYAIFDSITGQNIITPTNLPLNGGGQIVSMAQAYTIGSNFYVAYATTSTTSNTLIINQIQNVSPFSLVLTKNIDTNISILTTAGGPITYASYDGAVFNNNIYMSWLDTQGALKASKVTPSFTISSTTLYTSFNNTGGAMSVTGDSSSGLVYITIGSAYALNMVAIGSQNISSISFTGAWGVNSANYIQSNPFNSTIQNITSYASNGIYTAVYEIFSQYDLTRPTNVNNILKNQITANTGSASSVIGTEAVLTYSMGIGSKAFFVGGKPYVFGTFNSAAVQNTYFLLNSTGQVVSRIAYGNGGGFYGISGSKGNGLPSVNVMGSQASVSYLFKDLLETENTFNSTGNPNGTLNFTQTGINYGTFNFSPYATQAKDTGNALSIGGGFLWNYDGLQAVENNFFLGPDFVKVTADASVVSSGSAMDGTIAYQYQAIYEWPDNQANIHRSIPNTAPVQIAAQGTLATTHCYNIIEVPTLPASYHGAISPNKITLFRYSQNQQIFFKVGSYSLDGTFFVGSLSGYSGLSVTNSTFAAIVFHDHNSDAQINGNEIIYTTGNVLEDNGVSACSSPVVWDSRLWVILSESGQVGYSKPIIPATPIEMSTGFETIFLPPSQASQGATGLPKCIFPMDDKLIIFCKNVPFYINGTGPDITGANSGYSEPIQIPSAVGCSNPQSIVLSPLGLMFQSDNGIWLIGRDLSTRYIGKDVEAFTGSIVTAAVSVPGTSEIRFTLNTGLILTYDYLIDQWTTRQTNLNPVSGAIFNALHTQVNNVGSVYQETPGTYLDGSTAEVMSFTTGWVNLVNLQGYQRAYWMNILGQFQTGNTYTIGIAYDYNPAIVQTATITPTNTIGSGSQVEQWQVNFKQEQCQAFQLTFNEISSGSAGAGLQISGFDLVYGAKKTYPRNIGAKNRTG